VAEVMREVRLAVSFLTRLPVGCPAAVDARQLGRSMAWFPLVGLLLGGLLLAADWLLADLLPPLVGNALLLAMLVLVTGALHLDGWADLCDGVGGGRDRAAMLHIMKDSRIGVFGATGLVLLILIKFTALVSLHGEFRPAALLLAPVAGRWAAVLLTVTVPYLRGPEGTAAAFAGHAGRRELLLATLTLLAVAAIVLQWPGMLLAGLLGVAALALAGWARQRLGGVTGDVLGAAVELLELLTLLLVLGWSGVFSR
jgi:adenosylcobinamide-GDP ribazoletransferase